MCMHMYMHDMHMCISVIMMHLCVRAALNADLCAYMYVCNYDACMCMCSMHVCISVLMMHVCARAALHADLCAYMYV